MAKEEQKKSESISFFSKEKIACPVCGERFSKEEVKSGRGRFLADNVTIELRRTYKPTQKFGIVSPLLYSIVVCPFCFYAAFSAEFDKIPGKLEKTLKSKTNERKNLLRTHFPDCDFTTNRTFESGVASYYLTLLSYDVYPEQNYPHTRQAVAALRAAWLSGDLDKMYPDQDWDYMARVFYHKARFFYNTAIEFESEGKKKIDMFPALGPDTDKNYGYDGILYMASYLEYKYGDRDDPERRVKKLEGLKNSIAKVFGMGKTNVSKPALILERIRVLFENMKREIDTLST